MSNSYLTNIIKGLSLAAAVTLPFAITHYGPFKMYYSSQEMRMERFSSQSETAADYQNKLEYVLKKIGEGDNACAREGARWILWAGAYKNDLDLSRIDNYPEYYINPEVWKEALKERNLRLRRVIEENNVEDSTCDDESFEYYLLQSVPLG